MGRIKSSLNSVKSNLSNEIDEKKKSPFFHFGERMNLRKIPYDDFYSYVESRLPEMPVSQKAAITEDILRFTDVHPYYTQQLAAAVYNAIEYGKITENVVAYAIKRPGFLYGLSGCKHFNACFYRMPSV